MRVAVMMGGPSPEYDISVLSGKAVHQSLTAAGRDVMACLVTKTGGMILADHPDHCQGPALAAAEALIAMRAAGVKAVFLALHGAGGEDGKLQGFLEWAGMPFTGADAEASNLAMNKLVFKALMVEEGFPTPQHLGIHRHEWLADPNGLIEFAAESNLLPGFIKVASAGSSFGVTLVPDEAAARVALDLAFQSAENRQVIWEELIPGREMTVPLYSDKTGAITEFPVVEIVPKKASYFDLASKYDDGGADEICPAQIDDALAAELTKLATDLHRVLGIRGLSRSDFIIGPDGPLLLEINTIPGLTAASIFPKALAASGRDPAEFFWSMLEDACDRPLYGPR